MEFNDGDKMTNLKTIVMLICVITTSAHAKKLKNAIFIVGDGMGLTSITGTRVYSQGANGKLNIEKFPTIGLSKTYPTDDYTTDSAAGATAFSAGVKTYNGSIAMTDSKVDPTKKSRKLQTVFDVALKAKKSIGIVTTTRVTHATPACFYAHVDKRDKEDEIAIQAIDSKLNFLLGGGEKYFKPIREKFEKAGWKYVTKKDEFQSLDPVKTKSPVIGLFNSSHLTYSVQNKNEPELIDMVKWGLKNLEQNKNGYFFLIEAGRIDHAGHDNLAKEQFGEVLALDKTLQYLLDTVNLKDTIIVITADHETGGLSLNGYGPRDKVTGEYFLKGESEKGGNSFISWGTGPGSKNDSTDNSAYHIDQANHTTVDVPIYSIGLGHEKFGGFQENSSITPKILSLMGLKITDQVNIDNQVK